MMESERYGLKGSAASETFGERITERLSGKESRRDLRRRSRGEIFGEGIARTPSGKESRRGVADCSPNLT
jgi:hypothetical protein